MGDGGHLAVGRALESPYVDMLCGPQAYTLNWKGQPGISRGLADSARLHGKLWMDEMDTKPAIWDLRLPKDVAADQSIADLRSLTLGPLTRGAGLWYYDLTCEGDVGINGHAEGGWDTRSLQAEIAKLEVLRASRYSSPLSSPLADVLVVFDTESAYLGGNTPTIDPVSVALIDDLAGSLYRSGAAFHMIYFSDIEKADLSPYRAVVFANVYFMDDARRALVAKKVATDGRHLIWSCAAGYCDNGGCGPEKISAVIGIDVAPVEAVRCRVTPDPTLAADATYGLDIYVQPTFAVEDAKATVLGMIEGSTAVGLAKKQLETHTSWYSSAPLTEPAVLRRVFEEAGAHIYSSAGDTMFAGSGVIVLQTKNGGARTLRLRSGKQVEFGMAANSTSVMDAETGYAVL